MINQRFPLSRATACGFKPQPPLLPSFVLVGLTYRFDSLVPLMSSLSHNSS